MSAIWPISYLFHTLPQAKCISLSYNLYFSVYKAGSQTRLSIDVGIKETSEARLQKLICHLTMDSNSESYNLWVGLWFNDAKRSEEIFLHIGLYKQSLFGKQSIYFPEVEIVWKRDKMTWKREVGKCPSKTGGYRRKRKGWQVCSGVFVYLPVYIANGSTPHFNCAELIF